ncbi:MAG: hypothetical protein DHS20C11_35920 [Lysobacteraceae bacterium]|nr:MAG: hypothetical protein DHS20C11_35920 [Xanthomonadaceae bacterium]
MQLHRLKFLSDSDRVRVLEGLTRLRAGLDAEIGPATAGTNRLATWNLREFAHANKGGEHTEDAYVYIAQVIDYFDLVALQEVRGDLSALKRVMRYLPYEWKSIATDVTGGLPGNGERMVFLYRSNVVRFTDIAGELTLPSGREIFDPNGLQLRPTDSDHNDLMQVELGNQTLMLNDTTPRRKQNNGQTVLGERSRAILPNGASLVLPPGTELVFPSNTPIEQTAGGWKILHNGTIGVTRRTTLELPTEIAGEGILQFARTPSLVSFQAGWLKLMMCTVHIYYGAASGAAMQRRIAEIARLTKELGKRAKDEHENDSSNYFVVLGDFNIVGKDHDTMAALKANGFEIPQQIQSIPLGTNVKRDKFYDQIAYWNRGKRSGQVSRFELSGAGVFDFFKYVFRTDSIDPNQTSDAATYQALNQSPMEYDKWRTYQMSDHLPMWVELKTDYSNEYLGLLGNGTAPIA